ncbi:MAG: NUDIX hydrolase [Pseudomonadota bacterium]
MTENRIKDAATIIVLRHVTKSPMVLMGQRGAKAAFMPGKFVFPGGAVDPDDTRVPLTALSPIDQVRLQSESRATPVSLAAAAIRELWEETGQMLGTVGAWPHPPPSWRRFAETGHWPNGQALQFFFRAVTPPGRPRRFDARFFLASADDLVTDPDNFFDAEDELSHLQWVPLAAARQFDLPFITQVVIAELVTHLKQGGPPASVPFFRNDDEAHLISRLEGKPPR